MGEGVYEVNEKVHNFLPPKRIAARIVPIIPFWLSETNAYFIKLNLFGVLIHFLRFHIYEIQLHTPKS